MVCDLCNEREATVHLTEVINDQTRELHLCDACAREKGAEAAEQLSAEEGVDPLLGGGLAGLLAGLADLGTRAEGAKGLERLACAQCGLTYEDFRKTGRLGCGHCYQTFRQFLEPLLKRIHGSTEYVGRAPEERSGSKQPEPKEDLPQLKERLKAAVAAEQFEEAARLRDRIRTLEKNASKKKK